MKLAYDWYYKTFDFICNQNDAGITRNLRMLKHRSKMAIITYGSTSVILLLIGYFLGQSFSSHSPQVVHDSVPCNRTLLANHATDTANPALQKRLGIAEEAFDSTMRSCLGSFCFDDPVHVREGLDVVRIGVLIPDGVGKDSLIKMMIAAGVPVGEKLQLEFTSNVPPYGYGKNHGWSRIIRIARDIVPHSLNLLTQSQRVDDLELLIGPQVQLNSIFCGTAS